LQALAPSAWHAQIYRLTEDQLIGLRFAADDEVVELAKQRWRATSAASRSRNDQELARRLLADLKPRLSFLSLAQLGDEVKSSRVVVSP